MGFATSHRNVSPRSGQPSSEPVCALDLWGHKGERGRGVDRETERDRGRGVDREREEALTVVVTSPSALTIEARQAKASLFM